MKKFDFKPFDKVLVRENKSSCWRVNIFSHYEGNIAVCISGYWPYCVPYNKSTEHLLGTKKTYYKPEKGDFVFSSKGKEEWIAIVDDTNKFKDGTYNIVAMLYFREDGNNDLKIVENNDTNYPYLCPYAKEGIITRPATIVERDYLLGELRKRGKKFDFNKKVVVDIFNDGDFVKDVDGSVFIYKKTGLYGDNADCFVGFRGGELIRDKEGYTKISTLSFATPDEKSQFLISLHNKTLDWDSCKKKLVHWRYEPKNNDPYYYPSYDDDSGKFIASRDIWCDSKIDKARLKRGIYVFDNIDGCLSWCNKLNAPKRIRYEKE